MHVHIYINYMYIYTLITHHYSATHMQSVVTHLQAGVMEGCPAISRARIKTKCYTMTTALLNYYVWVDCFILDKLLNSLELASLARLQGAHF